MTLERFASGAQPRALKRLGGKDLNAGVPSGWILVGVIKRPISHHCSCRNLSEIFISTTTNGSVAATADQRKRRGASLRPK